MNKKIDNDDMVLTSEGDYLPASSIYGTSMDLVDDYGVSDTVTITLDDTLKSLTDNYDPLYDINLEDIKVTVVEQDFKDKMPDLNKVKDMCKRYPSLKKSYENFKSIFAMVEQDYKGKLKAENGN
tara:strand:+ start:475 stop:849 length:375 start_codon:yes stop_codon:yes gene_type:complete